MIQLNKLIKSYIFYIMSAFGVSITIKASIGVSSFNAMNMALSSASHIKIGHITMVINFLLLLIYMTMTHFKFKKKYLIQSLSVLMFGIFINFFTYSLMKHFSIEHYTTRLLLIAIGTMIGGLAIGMIVNYDTITFPLENVCLLLSEKTRFSFTQLRYAVDIICIIISLSLSLLYDLAFFVREGTLISFLLLSYVMGSVRKYYQLRLLQTETTEKLNAS